MVSEPDETEAAVRDVYGPELTPGQRECVETTGPAGGVIAYIHRLVDGHWFTFYQRSDGHLGVGICTCGEPGCSRRYFRLHIGGLIAAHEAKVQDFAAETRRNAELGAVVKRLYDALAAEWRNSSTTEADTREFYLRGFPDDEREALLTSLRSQGADAEADWIAEVSR